ncbi:MAG: BON domain-containing protein [Candidatus Sedimenticola sp. 6PFRAG7]
MNKLTYTITLALLTLFLAQGCAPVVVSGAATGVAVVHDRRSAGTAIDDQTIELQAVNALLTSGDLQKNGNFSATSYNRVVLLTGEAASESDRQQYEDMIRGIELVRRIVNEIQIGPEASLGDESKDVYLTTRVKLSLFDIKLKGFDPTRVKIVTNRSVVYLMGLVTPEEATAVVEKTRFTRGVKQVVKVFEYL